MCHSMLGPFKFGSNVNFVVGNNGSKCFCPPPYLTLSSTLQLECINFCKKVTEC